MINLDVRLKQIADFVENCEVFADIGSDHAYIPIHLLQANKIKKALITDINSGPLLNSRNNTKKYGCFDSCVFLLGDGITPVLPHKTDCLNISGMGGETIISILNENLDFVKKIPQIILQPMTGFDKLFMFLSLNKFKIDKISMVRDKHLFYYIIKIHFDGNTFLTEKTAYTKFDLFFSPILINDKDPIMREYLLYKLKEQNDIEKRINETDNPLVYENVAETKKEIMARLMKYETK